MFPKTNFCRLHEKEQKNVQCTLSQLALLYLGNKETIIRQSTCDQDADPEMDARNNKKSTCGFSKRNKKGLSSKDDLGIH